jgi:hypothetical protein
MQDRDALARQEEANREVISALGQLSRDVQAPPDFVGRVRVKADQQPILRPKRLAWLGRRPWGVDVAVAAVLVLAVVGAVPQYTEWFNTYVRGLPSEGEDTLAPLRTRGLGPRREDTSGPLRTRGLGPRREAASPTLPLGPWQFNAHGQWGQLTLTAVTARGQLYGTLDGAPMAGVWDAAAQQITLIGVRNPADLSTVQLFTGYLFKNAGGLQGVGTMTYTLAGSFTTLANSGASTPRTAYGWYAQTGVVE